MVNTVRVKADHGRDFNPLAVHMTKLQNVIKGENRDVSAFRFLLHLMLEQALSNLIVCLISQNYIQKLCKRVTMVHWIRGRFGFSQNYFEMRLEKNRIVV